MLSQTAARSLGRQVKARLVADRLERAKNTASTIEGGLAAGDFVEAWHNLKGWYCSVEDRAPKACPETLALQTAERVELYTAVPPPGWLMPINLTPIPVPDGTPTDHEIQEVLGKLRNGRAAGAMGMQVEHLKEWLRGIKREEAADGVEGAGPLEVVCSFDASNLGKWNCAYSDELDGDRASSEREGRLPWYWST